LESDIDSNTQYCTSQVPKLKSAHEEDEKHTTRRHGRGRGGSSMEHHHMHTAADIAMLERLGFNTEEGSPKMGMKGKGGKWNNKWQEKIETKKAQKSEIERELQANLEGFVTRSVENVIYKVGKNPITMQPKLLLSYALQRIVLPHGERMFKHFALNALSQQVFVSIYWFIHCKFFQPGSEQEQEHLLMDIAGTFVKLLANLKAHKDFFFKQYPYLLASSVTWGFHYLCPGSRHLYTPTFKRDVYLQVAELLLGMKVCPVSVQVTRHRLFPDDVIDEVDHVEQDDESETFIFPGILTDEEESKQMRQSSSAPSKKFDPLDTDTLDTNSAVVRLHPLETYLEPQEHGDESRPLAPAVRQQRKPFQASGISPLVQAYLKHPSMTAGRPGYTLQRTTPIPYCPVGGEDTFHKKPSRTKAHAQIKTNHHNAYDSFQKSTRTGQRKLVQNLAQIDFERRTVMRGGMSNIGRFCLDLVQKAESKHLGEDLEKDGH
jgi:hypothetical protein